MRISSEGRIASLTVALAALALAVPAPARAEMPVRVNYQGVLTYPDGRVLHDDSEPFDLDLRIYDEETGGALLFEAQLEVLVRNGLYNAVLEGDELVSALAEGAAWVEVEVVSGPGLSGPLAALGPRQRVTPVPFALSTRRVLNPTLGIGRRGPVGPQGPRGPEGSPGPQGNTGNGGGQGDPGPKGETGDRGDRGPRGRHQVAMCVDYGIAGDLVPDCVYRNSCDCEGESPVVNISGPCVVALDTGAACGATSVGWVSTGTGHLCTGRCCVCRKNRH